MSGLIVNTSDDNFEQDVLKAEGLVLVDFWADWCRPCKEIAPVLEELADEYKDKIRICKVDVSSNKEVAVQYGVRSIPTLILFEQGKLKTQKVGAASKSTLKEFIESGLTSTVS